MSKYKAGDRFELEIEQVMESTMTGRNALYRIKGFSSLTFDDYGLSLLKQIKPEEPEVDWTKVPVDTPILVRNGTDPTWHRRYFAKYEDGMVYTWAEGKTSWSSNGRIVRWDYAKLAEVDND